MSARQQPRKPRISFENHLLMLALAGGSPALVILGIVLIGADFSRELRIVLLAGAVIAWLGFAFAARRFLIYHLQTMSNLLEALREGDYSLRGRRARFADSLGEVMREVNALSETLRMERVGAREASALLMKVVDAIDIAVFAFDWQRRLRLVNAAGQRLLGGSDAVVIGESAAELQLAEFLDGPPRRTVQHCFATGAGRWEVRHGVFREAGRPHELLVITDMSRALREEERTAWRRLIRVIGHELNNSLAPIKSMTAMLRDLVKADALSAEWRADMADGLEVIGSRTDALTRFMTAYAMLARLPDPSPRWVALKPLIERVVALDGRMSVAAQGPELAAWIDSDQVEQLLINLVKNAIDAASETDGQVLVQWRRQEESLRIEVLDNGPGVSNSDNLFVPFFTTKPEGTGAGLVLCRQIAEAHGGSLSLDNRQDATGCVATLVIPQAGDPRTGTSSAGHPRDLAD